LVTACLGKNTPTTGIAQQLLSTSSSCALDQNYPNPFNPATTIQYALPSRSHVALTIFNTLGQIVRELVNGEMEAGYHSVNFDARLSALRVYLPNRRFVERLVE
jgi:hypothetical protein